MSAANLEYNFKVNVTGGGELKELLESSRAIREESRMATADAQKEGGIRDKNNKLLKEGADLLSQNSAELDRRRRMLDINSDEYKQLTAAITANANAEKQARKTSEELNSMTRRANTQAEKRAELMRAGADQTKRLKMDVGALTAAINNQTMNYRQAADQYEVIEKKIERQIGANDRLSKRVGITREELTKLRSQSGSLRSALDGLKSSVDRYGNSTDRILAGSTDLTNRLKILRSEMRRDGSETERNKEQYARLSAEYQAYDDMLKRVIKTQGISVNEKKQLQAALISMNNAMVSTTRTQQGMGEAFTGTTKVTNSANQILLSFGDILQDSSQFQYGFALGMRAIGNNITFAAEQFTILASKIAAQNKGVVTARDVIQALVKSFTGVGGIIIAINIAVTAFTILSEKFRRSKKEAGELKDSVDDLIKTLSSVPSGAGLEDPLGLIELSRKGSEIKLILRDFQGTLDKIESISGQKEFGRWAAIAQASDVRGMMLRAELLDALSDEDANRLANSYAKLSRVSIDLGQKIQFMGLAFKSAFEPIGDVLFYNSRLSGQIREQEKELESIAEQYGLTADDIEKLRKQYEELASQQRINQFLMSRDTPTMQAQRAISDLKDEVTLFNIVSKDEIDIARQRADELQAEVEVRRSQVAEMAKVVDLQSLAVKAGQLEQGALDNTRASLDLSIAGYNAANDALQFYLGLLERVAGGTDDVARATRDWKYELQLLELEALDQTKEILDERERLEKAYIQRTIEDADERAFKIRQIELKYEELRGDLDRGEEDDRAKRESDAEKERIDEISLSRRGAEAAARRAIHDRYDLESRLLRIQMYELKTLNDEGLIRAHEYAVRKREIEVEQELLKRDQLMEINEQISEDSLSFQDSLAEATKNVNQQLISSLQSAITGLIPAGRNRALASLAIEKALAIGTVMSDTQRSIAAMRVKREEMRAQALVVGATNPVAGAALSLAANAITKNIQMARRHAAVSIAKIAAVGLIQAASMSAGGDGGGGGGGGGGGSSSTPRGATPQKAGFSTSEGPKYVPGNQMNRAPIIINAQAKLDRRGLALLAREGESDIQSSSLITRSR